MLILFHLLLLQEGGADAMNNTEGRQWWLDGRIKKKLAQIYHSQGNIELFVEAIAISIKETLYVETLNQKVSLVQSLD